MVGLWTQQNYECLSFLQDGFSHSFSHQACLNKRSLTNLTNPGTSKYKLGEVTGLRSLADTLGLTLVQAETRNKTSDSFRLPRVTQLSVATVLQLNCTASAMIPHLRGLPFLPAMGPLGTVHTVSDSKPEKRAYYIAVILSLAIPVWLQNEEKHASLIFVQFKSNTPTFHASPRQIWTLIQLSSLQHSTQNANPLTDTGSAHM